MATIYLGVLISLVSIALLFFAGANIFLMIGVAIIEVVIIDILNKIHN